MRLCDSEAVRRYLKTFPTISKQDNPSKVDTIVRQVVQDLVAVLFVLRRDQFPFASAFKLRARSIWRNGFVSRAISTGIPSILA